MFFYNSKQEIGFHLFRMFSDSHTHTPAPTLGYMLWEPSALRSSVKLVGLVSWHGSVFNTSEVGPLGRTLGCFIHFKTSLWCVWDHCPVGKPNRVGEFWGFFYSIHSVSVPVSMLPPPCLTGATVFFILKALDLCLIWTLKFGLSMCATADMSLAWRCQFWIRGFCPWWCKTSWHTTVVGIKTLVGHKLHWRRVVFISFKSDEIQYLV